MGGKNASDPSGLTRESDVAQIWPSYTSASMYLNNTNTDYLTVCSNINCSSQRIRDDSNEGD